jgi:hypothetical protein
MKLSLSIVLATLAGVFSGCATAHPEQVPVIRAEVLPALWMPSLKPQSVSFTVISTRAINFKFKNTPEVVAAVKTAYLQSIYRGRLSVSTNSPNKLSLLIEDCPAPQDENLECVNLTLKLATKRYHVGVVGRMSNGLQRLEGGGTIPGMGDISKSYQDASAMVLGSLPKELQSFLKENSIR